MNIGRTSDDARLVEKNTGLPTDEHRTPDAHHPIGVKRTGRITDSQSVDDSEQRANGCVQPALARSRNLGSTLSQASTTFPLALDCRAVRRPAGFYFSCRIRCFTCFRLRGLGMICGSSGSKSFACVNVQSSGARKCLNLLWGVA